MKFGIPHMVVATTVLKRMRNFTTYLIKKDSVLNYDQAYYLRKNSVAPNQSCETHEKKRILNYPIRFAFSAP